ncbi:hypothetical protein [Aeromicrobium sp. IC_218]|uniref:hypothetical protein n=1 Tax=Aeromicrobium sp. IC_218 TaxID=2545468 RepID=UPI00103E0BC4|nr:hypothetical protein [Aeromicrobium sp. IC_218]TCI97614.1 hypothetical protein E0W78_11210 [Aeromicrobium sp. IC_218]
MAVLAALSIVPAAASAAPSAAPVVVSRHGLPAGFTATGETCDGVVSPAVYSHRRFTDGGSSWGGLEIGAPGTTGINRVSASSPDLLSERTMRVTAWSPSARPSLVTANLSNGGGITYTGRAVIPTTSARGSFDLLALTYEWTGHPDALPGDEADPDGTPLGSWTLAALAERENWDNLPPAGAVSLGSVSCPGASNLSPVVGVDRWAVGDDLVDFEAPVPDSLSVARSSSVVTYGRSAVVSTVYREAGTPRAGRAVELWRRRSGEPTFTRTSVVVRTGAGGVARWRVKPSEHTSYRWVAPAVGRDRARLVTSAVSVRVRPKVSLRLDDSTVRKGTTVRAHGRVAPGGRQVVSVYRKAGSRLVKLGSDVADARGNYRVRFTARRTGTWRVVTRVTAEPGYSLGQSSTRTLRVR